MAPAVFQHGVASGDPLTDRVVIWTHVTADDPVGGRPLGRRARRGDRRRRRDRRHDGLGGARLDGARRRRGARPRNHLLVRVPRRSRPTHRSPGPARSRRRPTTAASPWRRARSSTPASSTSTPGSPRATTSTSCSTSATTSTRRRTRRPASQTPGADIGRPFDPLARVRDARRLPHPVPPVPPRPRRAGAARAAPDHPDARRPRVRRRRVARRRRRSTSPSTDRGRIGKAARRSGRARSGCPSGVPTPTTPSACGARVVARRRSPTSSSSTRARAATSRCRSRRCRDPGRTRAGPEQREWLFGALTASTATWRLLANPSVIASTWSPGLPERRPSPALDEGEAHRPTTSRPRLRPVGRLPGRARPLLRAPARSRDSTTSSCSRATCTSRSSIELHRDPFDRRRRTAGRRVRDTLDLTSQNLDDKMGWPRRERAVARRGAGGPRRAPSLEVGRPRQSRLRDRRRDARPPHGRVLAPRHGARALPRARSVPRRSRSTAARAVPCAWPDPTHPGACIRSPMTPFSSEPSDLVVAQTRARPGSRGCAGRASARPVGGARPRTRSASASPGTGARPSCRDRAPGSSRAPMSCGSSYMTGTWRTFATGMPRGRSAATTSVGRSCGRPCGDPLVELVVTGVATCGGRERLVADPVGAPELDDERAPLLLRR